MAPESLADAVYSVKSDVFSFGVVVWEIVTRSDPWYVKQKRGAKREDKESKRQRHIQREEERKEEKTLLNSVWGTGLA